MSQPIPMKSSSGAIRVINTAIEQRRVLSEFENAKVLKLLDSMYHSGDAKYNVVSACYYALVSDIDNLLICSEKVMRGFKPKGNSVGPLIGNTLIALGNSLRFSDVYDYIKKYNIPLYEEDIIDLAINSSLFVGDVEGFKFLKNKNRKESEKEKDFDTIYYLFSKNESLIKDMSSYIRDVFDVISRKISRKVVKEYFLPTLSKFSVNVFCDEGYEFISFSFLFPEHSDLDIVFDLEDEFLSLISGLEYENEIKTKITFNFMADGAE